jgi:hypothetical protein
VAGKINTPITVSIQGLAKSISQLNMLGKSVGAVAKTAGLAGIAFGGFVAGTKFADFAVNAVAGARDLERNVAGLNTVFDEVAPRMEAFSKSAVNMGLSLNEASKASVFIGSVLKQSGFSINETADLTERLVGLATDLSITYGYDVQEALLGMTALFRGEYDPIEKFGVAMKQSEINAELAARSLSHLEGAERRLAEQQIRVELLFKRSADAQGAFARQSGTLAVEQQKLAASFANVKDTVATSLLPVIAGMMEQLQDVTATLGPRLTETFEGMAPTLERLVEDLIPAMIDGLNLFLDIMDEVIALVGDMTNPLTDVGESVTALGIQFESIFKTITGNELTVKNVFDIIGWAVGAVVDLIHDLLYVIENTIIGFKVMGEMAHAFFTGDWSKLVSTDWASQIQQQIELKDAINASKLEMAGLYEAARQSLKALGDQTEVWDVKGKVKITPEITGGGGSSSTTGGGTPKVIKDYVADFIGKLQEEVQKQSARIQLQAMGASEGLIDMILGSEGWMKVWIQIKKGILPLADLEKQYYRTAQGAKELADAQEKLAQEWADYNAKVAAINEQLQADLQAIAEHFDEVRLSFTDLMAELGVLPTIEREIGKFESAVAEYASSIRDSLKSAFRAGDLLEAGYKELQAYADEELALLANIQRQRDELADRYSLSESLIKEYRSALTSALSLTNLFDKLSSETQTRTVTEVSQGVVKLGNDLRTFNVTVSRSYEETLDSVADKSAGLLDGFRTMAEKARAFANNLRILKDMGLDPMLFNQLVQAGVEAGGETAQALVDGGAGTITEINSLFSEIDAIGAELGFEVSQTYYDSGQALIDQLLAGMRSQQDALEAQATAMAEGFNNAFQSKLDLAINVAQSAAENAARASAAAEIAAIPVPKPMIDQAALDQLDALITGAQRYAGAIGDATKAAGAQIKSDIYSSLRDVVASGGQVDLSGIKSGMSSADLAQAAAQASGGVVNNYTVNVTAETRVSGAKAGEAVVQTLKNYESANGPISTVLTT